jgi:superfamily II DNA/RNA helicase
MMNNDGYHVKKFTDLPINPKLLSRLTKDNMLHLTPIQSMALPITLTDGHRPTIIQSMTGSGKTLTYLIPSVQDGRGKLTTVIATPTSELSVQIYHIAKRLAGRKKESRRVNVLISGGKNQDDLMTSFVNDKPNIVIGTPKIINEALELHPKMFQSVRRLVLDEGDVMLKYSYKSSRHVKPVRLLAEKLAIKCSELICTSATIPMKFKEELKEIGWTDSPLVLSTSKGMMVPNEISHHYIHTTSQERISAIVSHFRMAQTRRALVFIHRDNSVLQFVNDLMSSGIKAVALYKETSQIDMYEQFLNKFKKGEEIEMVVGTEETVRGLDFTFVDVLYLLEVPRNAKEYLHLSGRVGRMGREGIVIVCIDEERDINRLQRIYNALNINGFAL